MKKYLVIGALLVSAILSSCSTTPQAQQPAAPVYQPVYGTSTLTVYTNPDGAPIEVNGQFIGHSPVTFPIETKDGHVGRVYFITAVANGPGQLTQQGHIGHLWSWETLQDASSPTDIEI